MSTTNCYIGIDPGFTGAIAFISTTGDLLEVVDTPIRRVPFVKKGKVTSRVEFDPITMRAVLTRYAIICAALEIVTARPHQGVTSMFRFGHGLGLWHGLLTGLDIPVKLVLPTQWKLMFDLVAKDKDAARLSAKSLFSAADLRLKKHHGRADALLLAEYARRSCNTQGTPAS